jgi:hypothetical protein
MRMLRLLVPFGDSAISPEMRAARETKLAPSGADRHRYAGGPQPVVTEKWPDAQMIMFRLANDRYHPRHGPHRYRA